MSLEQLVDSANTTVEIGRAHDIISHRIEAARQRAVEAEEGYQKLLHTLKTLQAKCTHPKMPEKMPEMFSVTTCPHCGGQQ
jgi:Zn finger protein HypA/HybF involved in hydrogenase expression